MQVPLRLCAAFSISAKQQSFLHCPQAHYASMLVAFDTLEKLLNSYHTRLEKLSNKQPAPSDSLAAAMQQQVLESGLPQSLPRLIAAVHAAVAVSHKQHQGVSRAPAGDAATATAAGQPLHYLNLLARECLTVHFLLSALWPSGAANYSPMIPSAVCALGLARTALQSIGSLLQHVPAGATGYTDQAQYLDFLVDSRGLAHRCIIELAGRIHDSTPGSLQPLLALPHLLPCMATTIAALALAWRTKRTAAGVEPCSTSSSAKAGSTDSSPSSSGGSSSHGGNTEPKQQKAA